MARMPKLVVTPGMPKLAPRPKPMTPKQPAMPKMGTTKNMNSGPMSRAERRQVVRQAMTMI